MLHLFITTFVFIFSMVINSNDVFAMARNIMDGAEAASSWDSEDAPTLAEPERFDSKNTNYAAHPPQTKRSFLEQTWKLGSPIESLVFHKLESSSSTCPSFIKLKLNLEYTDEKSLKFNSFHLVEHDPTSNRDELFIYLHSFLLESEDHRPGSILAPSRSTWHTPTWSRLTKNTMAFQYQHSTRRGFGKVHIVQKVAVQVTLLDEKLKVYQIKVDEQVPVKQSCLYEGSPLSQPGEEAP